MPRGNSPADVARLSWLLEQLENYVRRWSSFGSSDASADSAPTGALWEMVEIGADVLNQEMTSTTSEISLSDLSSRLRAVVASIGADRQSHQFVDPRELGEIVSSMQTRLAAPD